MSRSLFIGRYAPFHKGHLTLINKVLIEEKGKVVIGLRDTPIQETDPYSVAERVEMIKEFYPEASVYPEEGYEKADVIIMGMPDISEVVYGRKVGWGVRQLVLDPEIEAISATKIRESMKNS